MKHSYHTQNPVQQSSCCAHHHHSKSSRPITKSDFNRIYTCPMHPDVRQNSPGSCPLCGMALEPEDIPIEEIHVGDLLRVRPGEKVPVDGAKKKIFLLKTFLSLNPLQEWG